MDVSPVNFLLPYAAFFLLQELQCLVICLANIQLTLLLLPAIFPLLILLKTEV